jgi:hypothetical protein
MPSKSLMTSLPSMRKMVIDPVNGTVAHKCSSGDGNFQFSPLLVETFQEVETNYVSLMANRKYLQISDSMFEYLTLANTIDSAMSKQTNSNVKLLMQIAYDGLTGALHSKTMNRDNIDLNLQVALLNKKVEDILSGKNEVCAMSCTSGEIVITKTFKLAPLYSYYIHLYGMPAFGVGFDTAKLTLVASILQKYGINPFPN